MARAYNLSAPYRFTPARAMALKKARGISASNRHGRASSGIKVNYSPRTGPNMTGDYRFTKGRRKALARARKVNKNKKAVATRNRRIKIAKITAGVLASGVAIGTAAYAYRNHVKIKRINTQKMLDSITGTQRALGAGRSGFVENPVLHRVPQGGVVAVTGKGSARIIKRQRNKYNAGRRFAAARKAAGMGF